jgi:hypothetical protein
MKYEKPGGMKKIFVLFLIFVSVTSVINAQTTCGALTSNEVWSSNVHVTCDVTVGNGITLTISPGVIVSFNTGASLIISGSGRLLADGGSSSNYITFTAFNTSWGHLNFNNSTATQNSIINYCIIEKGNAPLSSLHGGGINASTSKLIISNTLIHNNNADWGGGVFVDKTFAPSISNCKIYLNTATYGGGGLYFWNTSSSLVTNCVIYKNTVTGAGYGGGGVLIGPSTGNVKIVNSVIANNTATNSSGAGIYFYTSSSAAIINSIIWGTPDQLYFLSTSTNVMQYCGIKGVSYTTCLNLNLYNNQPDGPNFTDPTNDDYSIKFISPCRDAGTSTGAPLTDFLGNSRVGPYDIGAYEDQYNTWKTTASSTDWATAGNWALGVPTSSQDVIIPKGATNYPTSSAAPSFTIGSGKYLIIEPAAAASFNNLSNNGTIRLESDASGIASLIMGRYFHSGTEEIQLFLPGGGGVGTYKWHYISSPVSSLATSVFTGTTPDLAEYDESRISNDQNIGWVGSDGWIYLPLPSHYGGPTFSSLAVGYGYNHYFGSDHTYTFDGLFNTGDVNNIPLAYNSGGGTEYPNAQGYNLLGNPFSSCLDWSQIAGGLNSSIDQAIYFNKSGQFASWVGGVGTNGGTNTIPPMQGFFVKTNATGTTITLPTSARVHNLSQNRYKKGLEIIPLVRLKLEDQANNDDAVVRFDDKATAGIDNAFDAYKFSKSGLSIWTSSGKEDFSINGLPFPDTSVVIPVSVNCTAAANLKISGTQIDGLENYQVTLTDNLNNITIDLKTTHNLSFDAPGGIVAGRFVLKVMNVVTAVPETTISIKPFNIYSSNGAVNIQTLSDTWNGKSGGIKVLDMTGRVFTTEDNVEFSKDALVQVPVRAATGIYMVEVRSGVMRYVGKVMIR